jgi:anthranilate synthase component 1
VQVFPEFDVFNTQYEKGVPQLVWATLPADLETPVATFLKLKEGSTHHLLFESVEGGKTRARYSIIALDPDLLWRVQGGVPEINTTPENPEAFEVSGDAPFDSLREVLKRSTLDIPAELPPMAAGLFGYMGYDMVKYMERLPDANPDEIGVPESLYMRPKIVVIFDSVKDLAMVITPVWGKQAGIPAKEAFEAARARVDVVMAKMHSSVPVPQPTSVDDLAVGPFTSKVDEAAYAKMVNKAKEYIVAGDIFQVVPSRRLSGPFELPAFSLYRSLRHLNPSPYLFYLELGDMALVGSSPEILVRVSEGKVTIRPIAGTRRRGKTTKEDEALEKELLADEKEQAEHLMLLDLGRNDVGRVAAPNSVKVTERSLVERYSHVMHIVSNVEGALGEAYDAVDALIAGFPAGTTSGAPKIRAMEIIDELETVRRSFYAGTVGYFSANGSMDTCIALRTGLVKDKVLYVQAGGGVVADSNPHDEFVETENKAGALMSAAKEARKFL